MIRLNIRMEDILIDADYLMAKIGQDESRSDNRWCGVCVDLPSGKNQEFQWTNEQMSAVVALMLDDDLPAATTDELYPIAEGAIEGWPIECRPFP